MPENHAHPLETILRLCQSVAPEPWYPKLHAEQNGVDRARLDPPIDDLRLGGWIQLTEWMAGKGQGYRLTDQGKALLADARAMAGVREGKLPVEKRQEDKGASAWERGEAAREAVYYDETPPTVRNWLIAANGIAFLAGLVLAHQHGLGQDYLAGDSREAWLLLDDLGALRGIRIALGEWWRLLTSCFLHGGWQHLAMNMLALFMIGGQAERMWGHWRFLLLYLLAGLGGSCLMLVWDPLAMVVGASGAICGVFAGQAVWLFLNRGHLPRELVADWVRNLIVMTVVLVWMSTGPHVAWMAHLGGALAGALAAVLVHYQRFGARRQRLLTLAGLILMPFLLVGLVLVSMRTSAWAPIFQRIQLISGGERPLQRIAVLRRNGAEGRVGIAHRSLPLAVGSAHPTDDAVRPVFLCLARPLDLDSSRVLSDPSTRFESGTDAADLDSTGRRF